MIELMMRGHAQTGKTSGALRIALGRPGLPPGEHDVFPVGGVAPAPFPAVEPKDAAVLLELAEPLRAILKKPEHWGMVMAYARSIERAHGIGAQKGAA